MRIWTGRMKRGEEVRRVMRCEDIERKSERGDVIKWMSEDR